MAIDSTLFAATIPAATYAVGDRIKMGVIRGPAIVRDGYGAAILKRIVALSSSAVAFSVHVKNSNWVDDMANIALTPTNDTALSKDSSSTQSGQNCRLTANSGWDVYAECITAGTTTSAADILALLDVDYPSVAAVQNPQEVDGFPVTIEMNNTINHTVTAQGSSPSAVWDSYNVDVFKAGSKYLMVQAGFKDGSSCGFMSISGAAGQAGLERIIPVKPGVTGMKYLLDYSTPLVKGPMNINLMSLGTAGTVATYLYMDFVKKSL